MLKPRWLVSAAGLAAAPLAVAAWIPSAAADSCRVMTVRYAVSGGGVVVLDPDHYDIAYGGCVQFVNQTAATTTITVGARYNQTLGPNENTTAATSYHGQTSGRQPVTATSGPAGSQAHGSITVAAAPTRSPSPSAQPTQKPSHTTTPAPAPAPSTTSSSSGPQVAPSPSRSRSHRHAGGGGLQPPVSPAGPVQTGLPTPVPAPAATAILAGPVEPASGRGIGLPAALAALAVVGCGAAFVRVLVAEPVDIRKTVVGQS